ncbi:oligosaccharide flippase family protein [Stutzerimonas azotifigens]|uniref:oligosaccharide flippase family protein n=1 Tax=Stutzerimonas azotifigens TaxID=291995 RepID=UPI000A05C09B|nr:oligosaccharide flippase family protein [Stutzerimonas azotifigens]
MTGIKTVKTISFLWIGSILGAGFNFLAQMVLARSVGAEQFGAFAASLAAVTMLSPLAGFGVQLFWLRAFGEEGSKGTRWLKGSLRLVRFTTLLIFVILLCLGTINSKKDAYLGAILALHIFGIIGIELVGSLLQIQGRYAALVAWQLVPHAARFLFICVLAFIFASSFSTTDAALAYAIVSISSLALSIRFLKQKNRNEFLFIDHEKAAENSFSKLSHPSATDVAKESWKFGLTGIIYLSYFQASIIILEHISGQHAAGIFSSAFMIIAAIYLFPAAVYQKFFLPKFHRWENENITLTREILRTASLVMLMIGVCSMLLLWLASPYLIPLLFGQEYISAIPVLNILAVAIPIRFLASGFSAALTKTTTIKLKNLVMGCISAASVLASFAVIQRHGIQGAAIVYLCTELSLSIAFFIIAKAVVFKGSVIGNKA